MYQVRETEAALDDLRETFAYLNYKTGGKQASRDLLDAYERAIDSLEKTPYAFPAVSDSLIASLGYRWVRIRSYLVFYTVDKPRQTVYIERISHASRNWTRLLG